MVQQKKWLSDRIASVAKELAKGKMGASRLEGRTLLEEPLLNRGVAFTNEERRQFRLQGLLPAGVANIDVQAKWAYANFKRQHSDIDRYIYLRGIHDVNETLFYHLLSEHIEEMAPIIYTPVVGLICQQYSNHLRRPRGLFLSYPDREHLDEILANWPLNDVRVAVVTDGERILGLGDQGFGGMGICVGKLALYTLLGGIHPAATLPITLDTGTDNPELLNDPFYLGWRHERIRGEKYDDFIERFVQALYKRFPNILLQWEDFAKGNARRLLDHYRERYCSFNDDIQGTAAVTLAGVISAAKRMGKEIRDLSYAIYGAGSAGVGVAEILVDAMIMAGENRNSALEKIWLFNSRGLVTHAQSGLDPLVTQFAKNKETLHRYQLDPANLPSLEDVVERVAPHALIGVSGQANAFHRHIAKTMAHHHKNPIIFPLSNPTPQSEAVPEELLAWTEGRALIATGSPFAGVAQGNNCLIFPGLGLGAVATRSKMITKEMFIAAARALADLAPAEQLLPRVKEGRKASQAVAVAVGEMARKQGLARAEEEASVEELVSSNMWQPNYN